MAMQNKGLALLVGIIVLAVLFQTNLALAFFEKPKYSESVYYSSPNWISNERIIYVKKISYYSHHSDFLSKLSKGTIILERAEFQICTMDIEGGDEKVIRSIEVNYRKASTYKEKDKIFKTPIERIGNLAYHPNKDRIVFSAAYNTYAMDTDGTNLHHIIKAGIAIDFSPDETKVIYVPAYSVDKIEREFWVMDLETGEKFQLTGDIMWATWHPSGKKITYLTRQKKEDRLISRVYTINSNGTDKEEFFTEHFPYAWSSDGNKFISYNSVYDIKTKTHLKLDKMPDSGYFSPDGTKIVGFIQGGDIFMLNSDGTGYKVLKDHRK